jgi:hypothetical protein
VLLMMLGILIKDPIKGLNAFGAQLSLLLFKE